MATELCAGQPGFESRQEQWFFSSFFCPHRLQNPSTALSGDTFVRGDMSKSWKLRRTFTQWVGICYAGTDSLKVTNHNSPNDIDIIITPVCCTAGTASDLSRTLFCFGTDAWSSVSIVYWCFFFLISFTTQGWFQLAQQSSSTGYAGVMCDDELTSYS